MSTMDKDGRFYGKIYPLLQKLFTSRTSGAMSGATTFFIGIACSIKVLLYVLAAAVGTRRQFALMYQFFKCVFAIVANKIFQYHKLNPSANADCLLKILKISIPFI